MTFQQKCTILGTFTRLKKGPKIRAWVDPPPPTFGQCPKVSDFFQRMPSLRVTLLTPVALMKDMEL